MSRESYGKKDEWLDHAHFRSETDGNVGRRVPSGHLIRFATVRLCGDAIVWRPDYENATELAVPESLLERFMKLWKSSDAAICAFARQWGILRLNDDGQPAEYEHVRNGGSEPLALWRFLSHRAYSLLRVAADLEKGKQGSVEDWRLLSSDSERIPYNFPNWAIWPQDIGLPSATGTEIGRRKCTLSGEVNYWISLLGLSIHTTLDPKNNWQLAIHYKGALLSAIGFQMALLLVRADDLYTCSACGFPYFRKKRQPKLGQDNFCEECGLSAAKKRADDRRRHKRLTGVARDPEKTEIAAAH